MLLFFLLVASVFAEQVPQTFTAEITMKAVYNGITYPLFNFTHYSLDNVAFRQTGAIPLGYPGSSTVIFRPPNHYTMIQPFFERATCVSLPIVSELGQFAMDFDARIYSHGKACPGDAQHRLCDEWRFTDVTEADNSYFLFANTTIPYRVVVDGENQFEQYDFHSFVTDPAPDPKVFDVPATQPCIDLVDKKSASMFAAAKGAVGRKVVLPLASSLVNAPETVAAVAQNARSWKARAIAAFDGLTFEQAAKTLRWPAMDFARRPQSHGRTGTTKAAASWTSDIPEEFDSRKAFPECGIDVIRNQGSCGSCWAFGAAESFSDRFCVRFNKSVVLSPQYLVSCFENLDGCDGGYLDIAWDDLKVQGTVLESCFPYEGRDTDCPTKCKDGSKITLFKPSPVYSTYVAFAPEKNVEAIQREIIANGPVEAALWVFSDLYHYTGGVYQRTAGTSLLGGHAIKIIGWGLDSETKLPFWTIANSWGTSWGEGGFFRIVRGTDECGIEDEIATGIPLPL